MGAEGNDDSCCVALSIKENKNQFTGQKAELLPLQECPSKEDQVDHLKEQATFVETPEVEFSKNSFLDNIITTVLV